MYGGKKEAKKCVFMADAGRIPLSEYRVVGREGSGPSGSNAEVGRIGNRIVLSEMDAAALVFQGIEKITRMQRAGVTHNDIQPSNLLIKDKKNASFSATMGTRYKLTFDDFGAVTSNKADGSREMSTINSTEYMCPLKLCSTIRHINGKGDGRHDGFFTDMFAFGKVMVELLGGTVQRLCDAQLERALGDADLHELLRHMTSMKANERWVRNEVETCGFIQNFKRKYPHAAQAATDAGLLSSHGVDAVGGGSSGRVSSSFPVPSALKPTVAPQSAWLAGAAGAGAGASSGVARAGVARGASAGSSRAGRAACDIEGVRAGDDNRCAPFGFVSGGPDRASLSAQQGELGDDLWDGVRNVGDPSQGSGVSQKPAARAAPVMAAKPVVEAAPAPVAAAAQRTAVEAATAPVVASWLTDTTRHGAGASSRSGVGGDDSVASSAGTMVPSLPVPSAPKPTVPPQSAWLAGAAGAGAGASSGVARAGVARGASAGSSRAGRAAYDIEGVRAGDDNRCAPFGFVSGGPDRASLSAQQGELGDDFWDGVQNVGDPSQGSGVSQKPAARAAPVMAAKPVVEAAPAPVAAAAQRTAVEAAATAPVVASAVMQTTESATAVEAAAAAPATAPASAAAMEAAAAPAPAPAIEPGGAAEAVPATAMTSASAGEVAETAVAPAPAVEPATEEVEAASPAAAVAVAQTGLAATTAVVAAALAPARTTEPVAAAEKSERRECGQGRGVKRSRVDSAVGPRRSKRLADMRAESVSTASMEKKDASTRKTLTSTQGKACPRSVKPVIGGVPVGRKGGLKGVVKVVATRGEKRPAPTTAAEGEVEALSTRGKRARRGVEAGEGVAFSTSAATAGARNSGGHGEKKRKGKGKGKGRATR